MTTTEQLTVNNETIKFSKLNIIDIINNKIKQEESNAIGISIILLIASSMVASFSAALSVHHDVNLFALIVTCVSAMGANAIALSLQTFKAITWGFLTAIIINVLLIIYQLMF